MTLTLWVQNNKGRGSEEACLHLSDSVTEDWNYLLFSHFYVHASLRKFLLCLCSSIFSFCICPSLLRQTNHLGRTSLFQCVRGPYLSTSSSLALVVGENRVPSTAFRGPSPSFITFHFFFHFFLRDFHTLRDDKNALMCVHAGAIKVRRFKFRL